MSVERVVRVVEVAAANDDGVRGQHVWRDHTSDGEATPADDRCSRPNHGVRGRLGTWSRDHGWAASRGRDHSAPRSGSAVRCGLATSAAASLGESWDRDERQDRSKCNGREALDGSHGTPTSGNFPANFSGGFPAKTAAARS